MADRHKGKSKTLYFTEEELAIIKAKAQKTNLNPSKYIRKMALEGTITIYDFKEADRLIYEINRIGNNVNQLARKANETSSIYRSDLQQMKKEYDSLCLMLSQYLLKLQSIKA